MSINRAIHRLPRRAAALAALALFAAASFVAGHAFAAGAADPILKAAIRPGTEVAFPALHLKVRLNRIIAPGAPDAVSKKLTEYNWTLTNTDLAQQVQFTTAVLIVAGAMRRMGNPGDELQEEMQAKSGAASVANTLVGGVLGMVLPGVAGSAGATAAIAADTAAGVASDAATRRYLVDEPTKAAKEIARRQFQGATAQGVTLLPTEAATGSVWMPQAASEPADEFRFFMKTADGASHVIELKLEDTR